MFALFKKRVKLHEQLISVVEYPGYLVFETYFRLESWLWKRTDLISIISTEACDAEKYRLTLKHLDLSKSVQDKDFDFESMRENYNRQLGRRSIKKQMEDTKAIQISRKYGQIHFTPTKNRGTKGQDKGYVPLANKEIIVNETDISEESINLYLTESFKNCE